MISPTPINDYRLTVRVRNNRLLRRIEDMGFKSMMSFCRAHNLNYNSVVSIVNMQRPAISVNGEWSPIVDKLCGIFGVMPDELFNERQKTTAIQKTRVEREVNERDLFASITGNAEALSIIDDRDESNPDAAVERRESVAELLEALPARERRFIELHYGLTDEGVVNIPEIARRAGVNKQRIYQLIARAEGRMKKRAHSAPLSPKPALTGHAVTRRLMMGIPLSANLSKKDSR